MEKIEVFLDSNVIISSILSKTGASFKIINDPEIEKLISKTVFAEVKIVSERLNIDFKKEKTALNQINLISINLTKKKLLKIYKKYVFDEEDSHVIAGTHKSKSKFLLTHNTKDFNINTINSDLNIIVLTPGIFLQYLRSLK